MTLFDGLVSPPPQTIAARFSQELADVVGEHNQRATADTNTRMLVALGREECVAASTTEIAEARAKAVKLLDELAGVVRELGEDIGFQEWRNQPTGPFKNRGLATHRRRRASRMSVLDMLEEARRAALSPSGMVDLDAPPPRISLRDFTRRPQVQVPEYIPHAAGDSPDRRVVGGREMAA